MHRPLSFLCIQRTRAGIKSMMSTYICVPKLAPHRREAVSNPKGCLACYMCVPLQVVREIPLTRTQKLGKCMGSVEFVFDQAAIAQLGERETEDLKVPSLILGLSRKL